MHIKRQYEKKKRDAKRNAGKEIEGEEEKKRKKNKSIIDHK